MSEAETMADMLEEEDLEPGVGETADPRVDQEPQQTETRQVETGGKSITDYLFAESPEKDLVTYKDHPLDFDSQESTWRTLRGLEGILGSLNYALVDIAIGVYQKVGELGGGSGRDPEKKTPEVDQGQGEDEVNI